MKFVRCHYFQISELISIQHFGEVLQKFLYMRYFSLLLLLLCI